MAFGIGLYSLHRDEIIGVQKAAWEERIKNQNSKVVFKSYKRGVEELSIDNRAPLSYDGDGIVEEEIDNLIYELEEEYY
jgi:hypothetical protein